MAIYSKNPRQTNKRMKKLRILNYLLILALLFSTLSLTVSYIHKEKQYNDYMHQQEQQNNNKNTINTTENKHTLGDWLANTHSWVQETNPSDPTKYLDQGISMGQLLGTYIATETNSNVPDPNAQPQPNEGFLDYIDETSIQSIDSWTLNANVNNGQFRSTTIDSKNIGQTDTEFIIKFTFTLTIDPSQVDSTGQPLKAPASKTFQARLDYFEKADYQNPTFHNQTTPPPNFNSPVLPRQMNATTGEWTNTELPVDPHSPNNKSPQKILGVQSLLVGATQVTSSYPNQTPGTVAPKPKVVYAILPFIFLAPILLLASIIFIKERKAVKRDEI